MDYVMSVIDKHIDIYNTLMENTFDIEKVNDYASAISALIMLKYELEGKAKY